MVNKSSSSSSTSSATIYHTTRSMTTVLPSEPTTQAGAEESSLQAVPLVSLIGVAVCIGLTAVAYFLIISIRYLIKSCHKGNCRTSFISFPKCACIHEMCHEGCCDDAQNNGDNVQQESSGNSREGEDWAPPRYNEALRMQRLDSTTILGIPPPTYSTLEHKAKEGCQDNIAFSRQVSQDSMVRFNSVTTVTGTHADILEYWKLHDKENTVIMNIIDNDREVQNGVDLQHNMCTQVDDTCSDETSTHESETIKSTTDIFERLPSYDIILSWIKGTKL